MLNQNTLLIVGAGASADFKLPLGPTLATSIAQLMPTTAHFSDNEFSGHLERVVSRAGPQSRNEIFHAGLHIRHNLPLAASIDSYLDSHREDAWRVKLAKMAIAYLIDEAESRSALACRHDAEAHRFDFSRVKGTWLQELWAVLHAGIGPGRRAEIFNHLKIATFNYDRCIEQFLRLAISNFYDCTIPQATEIVSKLGVLHIYGSLGDLKPSTNDCAAFNPDHSQNCDTASESIKTFTEPVSEAAQQLNDMIVNAHQIAFIGFSFGKPNLQLIEQPLAGSDIQKRVFGTAYEMDEDRIETARNWLDRLFSRNHSLAKLRNCKGQELISKFSADW